MHTSVGMKADFDLQRMCRWGLLETVTKTNTRQNYTNTVQYDAHPIAPGLNNRNTTQLLQEHPKFGSLFLDVHFLALTLEILSKHKARTNST